MDTSTTSRRNKEAKKEILKRIARAQKLSAAPTEIEIPRNYDRAGEIQGEELRELLIDRLVDYKADVFETDEDGLPAKLAEILKLRKCREVRYAPGLSKDLFAEFDGNATPDSKESDPRELDAVDAVVTDSHVSCAETGTITLEAGETNGRRALTLVPDRHICIVRQDTIVHRVPEMMEKVDPFKPSTMIAGPSATSDIELNRVEGVHGPRDLIVVIVH